MITSAMARRRSPPERSPVSSVLPGIGRNARSLQPGPLARPTLGKKQPQRTHDRDFPARQRLRYQGLAVRRLAQRRGILWSHTDRTRAFLRHRGVVDYQYGIAAADELIRLDQKFCFQRLSIPDPGRDEVV